MSINRIFQVVNKFLGNFARAPLAMRCKVELEVVKLKRILFLQIPKSLVPQFSHRCPKVQLSQI